MIGNAGYAAAYALAATIAFTRAPAMAGETADTAIASCLQELNLPQPVCQCIGTRAESELSETEQAFFIAMITGDQAEAASLRGGMTVDEMTTVAAFMSGAPSSCAGG